MIKRCQSCCIGRRGVVTRTCPHDIWSTRHNTLMYWKRQCRTLPDVYRADIRANVQLLAGDGLNTHLFESGKYMQGTTVDMSDIVHPNAQGHKEIAHALLDAL